MIDNPQHRLDFDGLDLTGRTTYPGGFTFNALSEGATLGNPVPVERSLASALLDGSFVVKDRDENREPSFQVQIWADDSIGLAAGEARLYEACSGPALLGWTPPDGWGARTVFRAFTSQLTHVFDDVDELRLVRAYTVRLVCHPFGFSEDEVVDVAVDAAPAVPSTTVISDGTSAAGWSSPAGAVTVSSGRLVVPSGDPVVQREVNGRTQSFYDTQVQRTLSPAADFSSTPYLSADIYLADSRQSLGARTTPRQLFEAFMDGVALRLVSCARLSGSSLAGWRMTWRCDDSAGQALRFDLRSFSTGSASFLVDNVSRSNVGPAQSSTGRQALRTLMLSGSARTAASLEVGHPSQGLGDVLVYTSTTLVEGYVPNLRSWYVGAAATPDPASVSGFTITLSTPRAFEPPASMLPPGPYLLLARISGMVGSTYQAAVSAVAGGVAMPATTLPKSPPKPAAGFDLVSLGVATLPPTRLPDEAGGVVRISIARVDGSGEQLLDELWAFHLGEGSDLTQVACGTGTPSLGTVHNRLFLDAPSLDNDGIGGLFVGTQPERTDAFDPGYPTARARGEHPLTPPAAGVFVVTTGATFPTVTARHRPTWFAHAGK